MSISLCVGHKTQTPDYLIEAVFQPPMMDLIPSISYFHVNNVLLFYSVVPVLFPG